MDSLKEDIEELKRLEELATRPKVRDLLSIQRRRLETDLILLEERDIEKQNPECIVHHENDQTSESAGSGSSKSAVATGGSGPYTVQITTYAWDQSDKYFKVYISDGFRGVHHLAKDKITCSFTPTSIHLMVRDLNNRNHELIIRKLYDNILPEESQFKVKEDMLLLMLRKATLGKSWAHVTPQEAKKPKTPKMDHSKDPSESLMDMLKQMYEDGDDDMKRTIAKAWSESRDKTGASTLDM